MFKLSRRYWYYVLRFAFVLFMATMIVASTVVAFQSVHARAAEQSAAGAIRERVRATEVNVQLLVDEHLNQRLTVVETQLNSLLKLLWLMLAGILGKTVHDHFNMHRMRKTLHSANNSLTEFMLTVDKAQRERDRLLLELETSWKEHEAVMGAAEGGGLREAKQ